MIYPIEYKSQVNHRKSQTTLPNLSLNELQKNYLALQSFKREFKNNQKFNLQSNQNPHDIVVKSPFYPRTNCCIQTICKCEFHRKIKFSPESRFNFLKNSKSKSFAKIKRLKTTLDDQNKRNSLIGKEHLNLNINQISEVNREKDDFLKELISKNSELYEEFLKKLQLENKSQIDCYNHLFQEFLQSHGQWILHKLKPTTNLSKGGKDNTEQTKNRFKTEFLPRRISQVSQADCQIILKDRYMKMSVEDHKKNGRRKQKKMTTYFVSNEIQDFQAIAKKFSNLVVDIKSEDRIELENILENGFKEIGLNYSKLKVSIQNVNFFGVICQCLADQDQIIVEGTKNLLRKIIRLPIHLVEATLKFLLTEAKNFGVAVKMAEKNVCLAFQTMENQIDLGIKNKTEAKGKQKMSITMKTKQKVYELLSLAQKSNQTTFSNFRSKLSSRNSNLSKNRLSGLSGFAVDQGVKQEEQTNENFCVEQTVKNQNKFEKPVNDKFNDEIFVKKKNQFSTRKANVKNLMTKFNVIKSIEEEIQFQNKCKSVKKNPQIENQYQKQIIQNRWIVFEQERRQQIQFIQKMKQKQSQLVSQSESEFEIKKNNCQAHYQRHKMFIKSIQDQLINNEQLKDMVINFNDNLFTKKRKARTLKKMIDGLSNQEFCQSIKKYLDIYQKNCQIISTKKRGKLKNIMKKDNQILQPAYSTGDYYSKISLKIQNLEDIFKTENQLKFYRLEQVQMEQEDYESIANEMLSYTTQKNQVSGKRKLNYERFYSLRQNSEKMDSLIQTGLDMNIISALRVQNTTELCESEKTLRGFSKNEIQPKQLRKIIVRFNKNMQKFNKILKTENNQS